MFARLGRSARRQGWLSTLVAVLAIAGQLTLSLVSVAEGRETRMASHVEASGSSTHFVHDETKCVSCQARSLQGAPARAVVPTIVLRLVPGIVRDHCASAQSVDLNHQAKPRAPPSLI
jgi:hypothetical protein